MARSLSPAERGNWPEFLRSMVMLERRPGVKPTKGSFNGPGTAVLEKGLAELKRRVLRRARKEGNDVPLDAWAEDGEGGGLPPAFCGGSLPEGALFDIRRRLGCSCLRLWVCRS